MDTSIERPKTDLSPPFWELKSAKLSVYKFNKDLYVPLDQLFQLITAFYFSLAIGFSNQFKVFECFADSIVVFQMDRVSICEVTEFWLEFCVRLTDC